MNTLKSVFSAVALIAVLAGGLYLAGQVQTSTMTARVAAVGRAG